MLRYMLRHTKWVVGTTYEVGCGYDMLRYRVVDMLLLFSLFITIIFSLWFHSYREKTINDKL